ncbi:MAG: serine hydrolase [Planctomycetes bacterium]|nr:serine hydrolase [Planctomycetota bacterium]
MFARAFLVLAALLVWTAERPANAQEGKATPLRADDEKEKIIARIERAVPRLLSEGEVPGLSVALIHKGELAWHHGFGVKNAKTKEPVGDDTVFEAASLSKPIFAYLVMLLVDAGLIDLDVPLQKYLPGNYDVGDDARLGKITARHVLSHTPGFPNWRTSTKSLKIHFTPGERFSYSGEGFVYLTKVVEHVTGEKLNDLLNKKVIEPLQMTDSSFIWRDSYDKQHSHRHNVLSNPTPWYKSDTPNAAYSLHTTARDYGRFLAAVIKGTGLKAETRRNMLTPQIKVSASGTNNTEHAPENLSRSLSWGLGWGLQTNGDGTAFWHWGDNGDTKSFVVVYDKQQLGLVVFTNSANGMSIIPEIVDEAIGGEQQSPSWLKYEPYNSPGKILFKKILANGADAALKDYRQWRKGRPAAETADEGQMNRLGYNLMTAKRLKDAIEVFKLNVEDYPKSANVWDSLGEAYMKDGNKELAILNYERSLELDPANSGAVEALKKLKAKQDK